MNNCPKCGIQVEESTKFCVACGAQMNTETVETPSPEPTPQPENQQQQQYQQPQFQPSQFFGGISAKNAAIASLVLGIVALALPIPLLGLAAGIIGIVLANNAKKQGLTSGMVTGGLVCSIVGTALAGLYTLVCFPACMCSVCIYNTSVPWYWYW